MIADDNSNEALQMPGPNLSKHRGVSGEVFVIAPPGLEAVVAAEIESMGAAEDVALVPGGVLTDGGVITAMRLCLASRTAAGVRLRAGTCLARTLDELAAGVRTMPWSAFFAEPCTPDVSVAAQGSRLRRRDVVARKVAFAIQDGLRGPRRGTSQPPWARAKMAPTRVHVRLEGDEATLSVDAAGELLHRRGWRSQGGAAPLRENLAASVLIAAGWRPGVPLLDAFTGSGTFLVEAAGMTAGIAPGAGRTFAFEGWPCVDRPLLAKLRASAGSRTPRSTSRSILEGWDSDASIIEIARSNASKAGVGGMIRWVCDTVDQLRPPASRGLVVANPPYGERLGKNVGGVWAAFGSALRAGFAHWEVALLSPNAALVRHTRLPLHPLLTFPHGGRPVTLWTSAAPGSVRSE
jgi:putative N6-adenine-specific DNA methylase